MKTFIFISLLCFCAFSQKVPDSIQHAEYDSHHSVILDGSIKNGLLYTKSQSWAQRKAEIKEQLRYSVGLFNGFSSVASLSTLDIRDIAAVKIGTSSYKIYYKADFIVAWDKKREIPASLPIILPESGTRSFLRLFLKKYTKDKSCLGSHAQRLGVVNHFYHYRPLSKSCSLRTRTPGDHDLAVSMTAQLKLSEKQTSGKSPEYHKVWEDNELRGIFLFSTVSYNPNENDYGVYNYRRFYEKLLIKFGQPTYLSLKQGEKPSLANNFLDVKFKKDGKTFSFSLWLTTHMLTEGEEFNKWYSARTPRADLISYGGHAGLGSNIASLSQRGTFLPGQYKLFNMNGCDTFAYLSDTLFKRHKYLNPGYAGSKFVDIVATAMPGYFSSINDAHISILNAFVEAKGTYQEIFSHFDEYQKSLVIGEEDND